MYVINWAPAEQKDTVVSSVLAVATIALAAAGVEAFLANRSLVDATRQEGKATMDAVDATQLATRESRRQWVLASTPFVRMERPQLTSDTDGTVLIVVQVQNQGPGIALQLRLGLSIQDVPDGPFRAYTRLAPVVWVLAGREAESFEQIRISARDLVQLRHLDWRRVTEKPEGSELVDPPDDLLVPDAIRVELRWLSMQGARAKQTYRWQTRNVNQHDPATWAFESLTIDPGEGQGEPAIVKPI